VKFGPPPEPVPVFQQAVRKNNPFSGVLELSMKSVKTTLAVIAFVAILIIAFQNLEVVDVKLLVWSIKPRKVFLILGTYLLGMITGWGAVELIKRAMSS
jgi:uncharacterized integral membrane protein